MDRRSSFCLNTGVDTASSSPPALMVLPQGFSWRCAIVNHRKGGYTLAAYSIVRLLKKTLTLYLFYLIARETTTMAKTTPLQNNEEIQAEAFQVALESKVLQGLGMAIENAVAAQNNLYAIGQAALANALQARLGGMGESAQTGKGEAPTPSVAELAERLQSIVKTGKDAGVEQSAVSDDPAQTTVQLMRAFSLALAMLTEVNTQQMLGYVLVVLSSEVKIHDLDAADARILVDLLTNNRLVQLLADLKATENASVA